MAYFCKIACSIVAIGFLISTASAQTGSLVVKKIVMNTTSKPTPNASFSVTVNCGWYPLVTLVLNNANAYTKTHSGVPSGTWCIIQELLPSAPPRCHWITTYPFGTTWTISAMQQKLLQVHNRLSCLER